MSNYKKDKSYIKQRLEYVSPVDYISKLEEKIEYLEYLKNENERLNNIIDKAIDFVKKESKKCYSNQTTANPTKVVGNFMWHTDKLLNILNGGEK